MASQLIVRNLEDEVVEALRKRASRNGRSAEAEHRLILRAALLAPSALPKPTLKELIRSIPKDASDDDDPDLVRPSFAARKVDL